MRRVKLNRPNAEAAADTDNVKRNTNSGVAKANETGYSRLGVNTTVSNFSSAGRMVANFKERMAMYAREYLDNLFSSENFMDEATAHNVDWIG